MVAAHIVRPARTTPSTGVLEAKAKSSAAAAAAVCAVDAALAAVCASEFAVVTEALLLSVAFAVTREDRLLTAEETVVLTAEVWFAAALTVAEAAAVA